MALADSGGKLEVGCFRGFRAPFVVVGRCWQLEVDGFLVLGSSFGATVSSSVNSIGCSIMLLGTFFLFYNFCMVLYWLPFYLLQKYLLGGFLFNDGCL